MLKKTNNQTKEKKSLKEVVVENKGKIISGIGTVIITGAGIVIFKEFKVRDSKILKVRCNGTVNSLVVTELWDKVKVTEDIINNSGIIDQARATVIRKRDTLVGKLNSLVNMTQTSDLIKDNIEKIKAGIEGYDKMLDSYDELEYLYKCRVSAEDLLSD